MQTVATVGYHRVAASLNGHDVIRRIGAAEHAQGLVEDLGIASDFDSQQDEFAVLHLPPLPNPASLDVMQNFLAGEFFGINDGVDTYVVEKVAEFGHYIFVVIDTGHGFLCSHA